MADKKFSAFTEDTDPAITDLVVGLSGGDNKKFQIQNLTKKVQLDVAGGKAYAAGQLSYDLVSRTLLGDTGFPGVRVNIGQEVHIRFFNDTGSLITNGTPINAAGADVTNDVVKGIVADITNPQFSSAVIGIATADVADGEVGIATKIGEVRDIDTSALSIGGVLYVGAGGTLTQTRPIFPNVISIIGTVIKSHATEGIVLVDATPFVRGRGGKSYSFTSNGINAGTYYAAGFYNAANSDADLSQVSPSILHGSTNVAYAAHAFCVSAGNGEVELGGVVGLRVTGTSITDQGVRTAGDTEILSTDITADVVDTYFESSKKWIGVVLYELYIVTGTPATYSLSFNYGYAKYEDLGNLDFSITDFEAVGLAGGNDTSFDIHLLHHKATGWTYAATGFAPGDGAILDWSSDMAPEDNLGNNLPFAWKRDNLSTFVDGNGNEGIIIQIVTGANSSVQSMDMHLGGVIEDLVY